MNEETVSMQVKYRVQAFQTRLPGRYIITLSVNDIDAGLEIIIWGKRRMTRMANTVLARANDVLNDLDLSGPLAAKVYAKIAAEQATKGVKIVQVGDKVRLLVDIGPYKRGRVFKVVEVAESTGYTARGGATAWDDLHYPIKVIPVSTMPDEPILHPKDGIPLAADEFCPGDKEVD